MRGAESGFNFDWIFVREIELRDTTADGPAQPIQDFPVDLEVLSSVAENEKACRIAMVLTYRGRGEDLLVAPILRIKTEAQFSVVGEETSVNLRIFAERQGPVLMVPFVREYLARISGVTRFGQILLNPLNMQKAVTGEMPVQK